MCVCVCVWNKRACMNFLIPPLVSHPYQQWKKATTTTTHLPATIVHFTSVLAYQEVKKSYVNVVWYSISHFERSIANSLLLPNDSVNSPIVKRRRVQANHCHPSTSTMASYLFLITGMIKAYMWDFRGYRSLLSSNTRASKCTGIRFEEWWKASAYDGSTAFEQVYLGTSTSFDWLHYSRWLYGSSYSK